MLLTTAIVIFFGSWLVLQGNLSTGAALALVVVFVQYAQQYFQPIVMMTSLIRADPIGDHWRAAGGGSA
jgi:ATP-binding cassette subfamily B multidrug efflux pump